MTEKAKSPAQKDRELGLKGYEMGQTLELLTRDIGSAFEEIKGTTETMRGDIMRCTADAETLCMHIGADSALGKVVLPWLRSQRAAWDSVRQVIIEAGIDPAGSFWCDFYEEAAADMKGE